MPHPKTLLSLYPPKHFDELVSRYNPKHINVYVDLKNVMTSMFVPTIIEEIVFNTKNNQKLDSSFFQSIIFYSNWWCKYCHDKNVTCSVHISTDYGRSVYHNSIWGKYKENRIINQTQLTQYDEEFSEIRKKNTELAENVIKKLPNVYFYFLRMLEADFIPYYLITRKFNNPEILHIVCSNDHDMYQILSKPNTIQLFRYQSENKILTEKTALLKFLGVNNQSVDSKTKTIEKFNKFDLNYLSSMMAVIGDIGDNVPGVDGFGPKRTLSLFDNIDIIKELIGSPNEIEDRISSGGYFLKSFDSNKDYGKLWNKILSSQIKKYKGDKLNNEVFDINELLTNSYKLQSFEQLCRWLEKKDTTSKFDWLRYIDGVVDKHIEELIPTPRAFLQAASKLEDNYITENDISSIYNLGEN